MNVRQEVPADFGCVARDLVVVAALGQSCVTAESVRDDVAPTFRQVFNRRDARGGGAVGNHKQPDPADAHSPDFGGDQHERFSGRAAASFPGFDATEKCLVYFPSSESCKRAGRTTARRMRCSHSQLVW